MRLAELYFADPRLVLVPIEHLTEAGMSRGFAALVADHRGWSPERIALFDAAFSRYWTRSAALARRTRTWPAPRLRHVAVVREALAVRPYVQLLNTSAWMIYDSDLDPERSHPELAAYLLVLGDRMALSGEVATAALHAAAYWFERSAEERAAFANAAAQSTRPDASMLQAVATALPWLGDLRHESVRPPVAAASYRAVPATGLLVPKAIDTEPAALVERAAAVAQHAVATFHAAWRRHDRTAVTGLADWLGTAAPRLLITAQRGRIVWDPEAPTRVGGLVGELRDADAIAVHAVREDLEVVDSRSRAFLAALATPEALPAPDAASEQSGYAYLHRERRLIAYNLHEPGMERLRGPALPYARAMLAARTVHEWAHLAADAGWVPPVRGPSELELRLAAFAMEMDAVIATVPHAIGAVTGADLAALAAEGPGAGGALARVLLARMPDYQANLVARRFLTDAEQEVYVRQNVRALRRDYPPARLWRMLVRYLYEYQYLGFSAVEDARTYFLRSTWFDQDLLESGVLDDASFDRLTASVAAVCGCYAVDQRWFR